MDHNREKWRFMRDRAQQLFEEGDVKRSLRLMRLINAEQEERFARCMAEEEETMVKKIVSTH